MLNFLNLQKILKARRPMKNTDEGQKCPLIPLQPTLKLHMPLFTYANLFKALVCLISFMLFSVNRIFWKYFLKPAYKQEEKVVNVSKIMKENRMTTE